MSEFLAQIGYERGLHALHPSESGHFKGRRAEAPRGRGRALRLVVPPPDADARDVPSLGRLVPNARWCTIMREPVSRFVSTMRFVRRLDESFRTRRRVGRIDPEEAPPRRRREHVLQQRRLGFKWRTTDARLRRVTRGAARGRGRHHGAPRRAADAGADAKGHGGVSRIARVVAELGPRRVAGAAPLGARRPRPPRRRALRGRHVPERRPRVQRRGLAAPAGRRERRFDAEIARRAGDEQFRANRRAVVAAPARNAPPFASKYPINCQQPNTGPPEPRRWKAAEWWGAGGLTLVRNVKGKWTRWRRFSLEGPQLTLGTAVAAAAGRAPEHGSRVFARRPNRHYEWLRATEHAPRRSGPCPRASSQPRGSRRAWRRPRRPLA